LAAPREHTERQADREPEGALHPSIANQLDPRCDVHRQSLAQLARRSARAGPARDIS